MSPVELNETDLELEVPDPVKLKILFDELEFKTVATRILAEIDKSVKPRETQQLFTSQKDSHRVLFSEMKQSPRLLRNRQLKV